MKFFPNRTSLNFSNAAAVEFQGKNFEIYNMDERALNIVARVLPHLKELDISGTGLYAFEFWKKEEAPFFPRLQILKMDLTEDQRLCMRNLSQSLFPGIPTLRFLSVKTKELHGFWFNLVVPFFRKEESKYPELEEIDATDAHFGEKHAKQLVQTLSIFKKLKKMHLTGSDVAKNPDLVKQLQAQYPQITFIV